MIDGLIGGRLYGKPVQRTARNGSPFVTAKIRVTDAAGEAHFANVISFSASVTAALCALDDGDAVTVAGELTPRAWIDRDGEARPGLDVAAHVVLTAYHATRRRRAMAHAASDGAETTDDALPRGAE